MIPCPHVQELVKLVGVKNASECLKLSEGAVRKAARSGEASPSIEELARICLNGQADTHTFIARVPERKYHLFKDFCGELGVRLTELEE